MSVPILSVPDPVGQFAVMRQAEPRSARFVQLHATRAEATLEAQRLTVETFKAHPEKECRFYVIEILAAYGLGPAGLLQIEG